MALTTHTSREIKVDDESRQAVVAALIEQGLSERDAECIAVAMLSIDWEAILMTRRELSEATGVPLATISYHATRLGGDERLRPLILKRGRDGRPSQSLFLAPIAVSAFRRLAG